MDFPSSDFSLSNLSNLSIVLHPDLSLHEGQFVGNLLLDEIRHRSIGRAFRPRSKSSRGTSWTAHPVSSPFQSSRLPNQSHMNMVDTWWIPGGFGNCTRSCLDTSWVLTFSCPSCQFSSDSHFFPDNWSAPGSRRTWETPGEQCPLVTLSGLVTMTMKHHQNLSKSYPLGPRRFYCLFLPWRSKASALSSSAARSTSWHGQVSGKDQYGPTQAVFGRHKKYLTFFLTRSYNPSMSWSADQTVFTLYLICHMSFSFGQKLWKPFAQQESELCGCKSEYLSSQIFQDQRHLLSASIFCKQYPCLAPIPDPHHLCERWPHAVVEQLLTIQISIHYKSEQSANGQEQH